ncbi:MAG TPA: hypothetical protein VFA22_06855 [Stellaceae bacterium]|nr:hypothetical protein [Stellaceae bacterium]
MLKALLLLVLTSLVPVGMAEAASPAKTAPKAATTLVAPAAAAETPAPAAAEVQPAEGYLPPTSPSFFDFLSSGGLTNIAKYCAIDMPDKPNQWLHGFICSVRVTDVAIGFYTGLLVIVLVGLVLVGVVQYELFSRTARQQLRSYLLVESAARAGEHDENPEFQIVIKNFGQTPAYRVRTWIAVRPGERTQAGLPGPEAGTIDASDAALGPGGSIALGKQFEGGWDEAGLEDFLSGRIVLFVYGEVTYRDAFNRRRYTRFRAMYGAEHFRGGGLSIAARGNESN